MVTSSLSFRLKSSTSLSTLEFEGTSVRGREARNLIACRMRVADTDVVLFLNGTQLTDDAEIPAFSRLDVVRVLTPVSTFFGTGQTKCFLCVLGSILIVI